MAMGAFSLVGFVPVLPGPCQMLRFKSNRFNTGMTTDVRNRVNNRSFIPFFGESRLFVQKMAPVEHCFWCGGGDFSAQSCRLCGRSETFVLISTC